MGRRLRRALDPFLQRATGRRTRAFVLSGGGSLGAVQVGMLRALVEAGIKPDLVIGCSVGAINGAGFAADPTLRGVARMERIWRRMAAEGVSSVNKRTSHPTSSERFLSIERTHQEIKSKKAKRQPLIPNLK